MGRYDNLFCRAGNIQTVEFDFDLANDTAMSVASEMVEEMSLSHNDAHKIAHAIKDEIVSLTQQGSRQGSATQSLDSNSDDESLVGKSEQNKPDEPLIRQESSGTKYEAQSCVRAPSRNSLSAEPEIEPINTQTAPQAQSRPVSCLSKVSHYSLTCLSNLTCDMHSDKSSVARDS